MADRNLIARWTTPAVTFKPSVATVDQIVEIVMTIKQGGRDVIRKTLEDATVSDGTYMWSFSQSDSSQLASSRDAFVQIDYKTTDGMRYTVYPPRLFSVVNSADDKEI